MTYGELKNHNRVWTISLLAALAAWGLPRAARATTFAELPRELQGAVRLARELEMDVTGLRPELVDSGRVALRATHGAKVLTYGELRVTDARGRALPAHLEVAKGSGDRASVRLLVDDAAAAYPVTVDPLIVSQQAELAASDGATFDHFGFSAALSSDGNTALVGAVNKTVSGNTWQGAAYVFVRSGTTWTQQAELTASDGAIGAAFGSSAALSSDGNTALIGAWGKTVSGNSGQGAAYVFVRKGTTWTQQAELTASNGAAYNNFGWSAALSSDGTTALIGADAKTVSGNTYEGAAYVFVRSGTTWTQQGELTASDRAAYFGSSAALSSDGTTALLGAYYKTVSGNSGQGAGYVFVRSGTTWTQQAELTASDGASGDEFGISAALSSDGTTALIGAVYKTVNGDDGQGAAYVFVRSGTTWTQQAELTASDGAIGDEFGSSTALSSDGTTALIGAYDKTVNGNIGQGAAYVFVLSACIGDCYDDGQVTVDEILTMVNIALGNANISTCLAGDADHDGQITVDEILMAVNNLLNGCGG